MKTPRARGVAGGTLAIVLSIGVVPAVATAHGPDPVLGGTAWAQDQTVTYQWRSGQVPPDWMALPINAAAGDATSTRASRAASFVKTASTSASLIAYGEPTGCSAAGIACFDRSGAPTSFRMWFRAHGYAFDWGTLRWCQGQSTFTNGCFDVETIALDEFGHVDDLGHHVNLSDGSDYLDAVVQTLSHAMPQVGWSVHAFGRCDTGRLQIIYDRALARDLFSSCLDVPTATSLAVSDASISVGDTIRFTATLRTSSTASGALANDPVSARSVVLQRRVVGATAWTTMGTMSAGTTEGTYVYSISPTATYEWRAYFTPVAADGALASSSSPLKVAVSSTCTGSGCPSVAVR
jgi:hypothetical protein